MKTVKEIYKDPVTGVVSIEYDDATEKVYLPQEVATYSVDVNGVITGLKGMTSADDFLVVSNLPPVDTDGRPNGTIYIQTGA